MIGLAPSFVKRFFLLRKANEKAPPLGDALGSKINPSDRA
jgi:hypothetical protein